MNEQKTNDQFLSNATCEITEKTLLDTACDPSLQRSIDEITKDILLQKNQLVHSYIKIGLLLTEAKEQLENGHGSWLKWLSDSVDISERMAQHYMRLAKEYPNPNAISDLGFTKALALLALPEIQREDFIRETHTVNGKSKSVADMSTRELKKAIRQHTEAMPSFKPITRDSQSHKVEVSVNTSPLTEIDADLKAAKKHMESILNVLREHPENQFAQFIEDLRDLQEQIKQCVSLVGLEVTAA